MTAALLSALSLLSAAVALRPLSEPRNPAARPDGVGTSPARPRRGLARHIANGRSTMATRRRPASDEPSEIAAWCDQLARATHTGSSLTAAIRDTSPPPGLHNEIAEITHALDRGVPLSAACATPRIASPHGRLAFTVLQACADHGGPPAEPIDRAASALRARAADAADRQTQSAQARASARVMTLLPIGALASLVATSGAVRAALMSPIGLGSVIVGGLANLVGWRWMMRIVAGAER